MRKIYDEAHDIPLEAYTKVLCPNVKPTVFITTPNYSNIFFDSWMKDKENHKLSMFMLEDFMNKKAYKLLEEYCRVTGERFPTDWKFKLRSKAHDEWFMYCEPEWYWGPESYSTVYKRFLCYETINVNNCYGISPIVALLDKIHFIYKDNPSIIDIPKRIEEMRKNGVAKFR